MTEMRREGLKGRLSSVFSFAAATLLAANGTAHASGTWDCSGALPDTVSACSDEAFEKLAHYLMEKSGEDAGASECMDLEELLERRIRINGTDMNDRTAMLVLGAYRIHSLNSYIGRYGNIISYAELASVPGFGKEFTELVRPFTTLSADRGYTDISGISECFRNTGHEFITRSLKKFTPGKKEPEKIGTPYHLYGRYTFMAGETFSAGLTFEKDDGEKFFPKSCSPEPDMFSFHVHASKIRLSGDLFLESLVAGDYRIGFGYGLALSGSTGLFSSSDPMASGTRNKGLSPYRSVTEHGFFRGAAATLRYRSLSVTPFFSLNRKDAAIKDGMFTSLPETGIHDTEMSLAARRTLSELAAGIGLSHDSGMMHVGLNWVTYAHDRPDGRKLGRHNMYTRYNGFWGNISTDMTMYLGKLRIFAEAAVDYTPDYAVYMGAAYSPDYGLSVSVTARSYGAKYKAPHSAAESSRGTTANEHGGRILINIRHSHGLSTDISVDGSYHPYPVFGTDGSSWKLKSSIRESLAGKVNEGHASLGLDTDGRTLRISAKAKYRHEVSENLALWADGRFTCTADLQRTPAGYGTGWFIGAGSSFALGPAETSVYAGGFSTMGWDSRVYMFEKDLMHTYSGRTFYGNGFRCYLNLRWKISRIADMWIKSAVTLKEGNRAEVEARIQFRLRI